jgi:uncharacterized membrane protein
MIEKEKRKPELGPSWFRSTGCLLMLIAVGIGVFIPIIDYSRRLDLRYVHFLVVLCFFILGMCVFSVSMRVGHPTLNEIRQSPDDPLIVQQWNGRDWVNRLDMRSAINDAQGKTSQH